MPADDPDPSDITGKGVDEEEGRFSRRQIIGGIAAFGLAGTAASQMDLVSQEEEDPAANETEQQDDSDYEDDQDDVTEEDSLEDVEEELEDDDEDIEEELEDPDDQEDVYMLEEQVEVDYGPLDDVYSNSDVTIAIQDNGNMVAWNEEVDDEGIVLYYFRNEVFPNRDFHDVEGDHPVEEFYSEISSMYDEEQMPEYKVSAVYNDLLDDRDWREMRDYIEVSWKELMDGVTEYGDEGQAVNYFFNRSESLARGEPVLQEEWSQLMEDGLEQTHSEEVDYID